MPPFRSMTGITRKLTGVITSALEPTILVHEWVTGGGMAAESIQEPSWAPEGHAMRRAIAREFAALNGGKARVIVTLDARFADDPGPWTVARVGAGQHPHRVPGLAREADLTVLVAPETMGFLEDLTRSIQQVGARHLGSSLEAVALTRDKARLAGWLRARGIETPPCRRVSPSTGLPSDAPYPAVLKPNDGAGSIDTYLVMDPESLPLSARYMGDAIMQPYLSGQPMSASYLVDGDGRPWLLGIGEQLIELHDGVFLYRGGRLPSPTPVDEVPLHRAVESVPGLQGFVGVDFIWDGRRKQTTVLEINPRPTTSLVGLAGILPPGRLASAWIGAFDPTSPGAALLPGLSDLVRAHRPLSFDATGVIDPGGGSR
jgi:predicted ATP-grasp superfamily ATP-dependent carboligase